MACVRGCDGAEGCLSKEGRRLKSLWWEEETRFGRVGEPDGCGGRDAREVSGGKRTKVGCLGRSSDEGSWSQLMWHLA